MRNFLIGMSSGFSLVELLITLFLISLLAGIAYPYYGTYLLKSHRTDAMTTLIEDQIILEHCYSQNNSYSEPCSLLPSFPHPSHQGFYSIHLTHIKPHAYRLLAKPIGTQIKDTACARMSIDERNTKNALDFLGRVQSLCWL